MSVDHKILEALTAGIQSEVAAYVFYFEAAKIAQGDQFKDILKDLAGEEKKHFQILERKYDALVRSEMWISTADALKAEDLPEIDAKMAAKHEDLIKKVQGLNTPREILEVALQLEIDAQKLFTRLANEATADEAKRTFRHLVGFEEGHAQKIRDMIANL